MSMFPPLASVKDYEIVSISIPETEKRRVANSIDNEPPSELRILPSVIPLPHKTLDIPYQDNVTNIFVGPIQTESLIEHASSASVSAPAKDKDDKVIMWGLIAGTILTLIS